MQSEGEGFPIVTDLATEKEAEWLAGLIRRAARLRQGPGEATSDLSRVVD